MKRESSCLVRNQDDYLQTKYKKVRNHDDYLQTMYKELGKEGITPALIASGVYGKEEPRGFILWQMTTSR